MNRISLTIIENHPVFRYGLRSIIASESDMAIVAEYDDCLVALQRLTALQPDVVIVELALPNCEGTLFVQELATRMPEVEAIVLTASYDETLMLRALSAGASAYIRKSVEPPRLLQAIRDVAAGWAVVEGRLMDEQQKHEWLADQLAQAQNGSHAAGPTTVEENPLSSREQDVLVQIVKGKSNREIATALHISPQTVKNHVSSILRKSGLADRTQVAVHAIRHGWATLDEADG